MRLPAHQHFAAACVCNNFQAKLSFGLLQTRILVAYRLVDKENVGSVFCLQQDSDMEYFDLDIDPILARAADRGDVQHVRYRINDFDAFDLRMKLPGAAAALAKEISQGRKAYVHCTAGKHPCISKPHTFCGIVVLLDQNSAFIHAAGSWAVQHCRQKHNTVRNQPACTERNSMCIHHTLVTGDARCPAVKQTHGLPRRSNTYAATLGMQQIIRC